MVFNSYIFILVFLPLFVALYFLFEKIRKLSGKYIIILAGIIFYCYAGWNVAAILGISIVANYLLSYLISKIPRKKKLTIVVVALNIGILFFFKYLNFTIDIVNNITRATIEEQQLILPLGISFFTFQQIMFVVSVFKGNIKTVNLVDYLAYILYFPKLTMGPLMEPIDYFTQINSEKNKMICWDNISSGLMLFSLGLFKKMILADTFSKAVTWGFKNGVTTLSATAVATSGDLILVMLFYTFQIYFDFSGYSDMAVGISQMVNITLPQNFDSPYKATSIRDFWKRWHMSLTSFFTKYIYFPLGGSRKGYVRTYVNIMVIFLISGLWHGANYTFILWGCIHGFLQVIERVFKKAFDRLSEVVRWGYTFLSVNLLWLLFRSDSIKQWGEMLTTIFRFQNMSISEGLINTFALPETVFIFDQLHLVQMNKNVKGLSMLVFILVSYFICLIPENNYIRCIRLKKINCANMIICAIAFIWGFLCLSSESVFVYFDF